MDELLTLRKFIQFSKVDSVKREVSGIVTAEQPDKDREVCDYAKSKPFYEALISEMTKATDGQNCMPLRRMHQLDAVGKGIGFHFDDAEKEIVMTFKVVDDDAWKKVEERVYTGFSQGGRKVGDQVPDPVYKGCMRYVANPSEVSLVDNPCLPSAHFAYVKADGTVELRKFLNTEVPQETPKEEFELLKASQQELSNKLEGVIKNLDTERAEKAELQKALDLAKAAAAAPVTAVASATELAKEGKTKRVAGKDLGPSSFAYVGDPEKTETWKFPIHDKAHARNALARFNQAKGIPASEKGKVRSKIVAAAKKFGIDVASETDKCKAILSVMRKAVRVYVNENFGKVVSPGLQSLDSDLGKLAKGMWEVSRLACYLEDLAYMVFAVANEEEWEMDEESALPQMLAENVAAIAETFTAMVDEETRELLAHTNARADK